MDCLGWVQYLVALHSLEEACHSLEHPFPSLVALQTLKGEVHLVQDNLIKWNESKRMKKEDQRNCCFFLSTKALLLSPRIHCAKWVLIGEKKGKTCLWRIASVPRVQSLCVREKVNRIELSNSQHCAGHWLALFTSRDFTGIHGIFLFYKKCKNEGKGGCCFWSLLFFYVCYVT